MRSASRSWNLAVNCRESLIERHPHPIHGRILQVELTDEGDLRVGAAAAEVRALEQSIEAGFTASEIAIVKRWLVESALRTERLAGTRRG